MVMIGEIHTGLLRNSAAVSPNATETLLAFIVGERVRSFSRPVHRVMSPHVLTGVDCHLPTATASSARVVGTVVSRAVVTGGHVVQGSAYVRVAVDPTEQRRPWSHYLAHPGSVHPLGKLDRAQLPAGHLTSRGSTGKTLDLGALSIHALDAVQGHDGLDQSPPFKSQRTRLRWAVPDDTADGGPALRFDDQVARSLTLPPSGAGIAAYAGFCEDLALHDWLLTTVLAMIGKAKIGSGDRKEVIDQLSPAIDYLAHLWMPAFGIDPRLVGFWNALDQGAGLGVQWKTTVDRIRDQLVLAAVTATP